ncbi:FtsQ-type POTRA domain-containing protein [Sphingomonas baiyangensis]|uniref:Cell division protein FtsQ n=2 Tax=Sphingomonas baiyangensis TaxID=2572576 RepID=A0A4V5PWL6_9SPHN|nr:FtsQ-type POTRA domain-containing protein [Sphingomonas baiyangensis]
MQQRRSAQRRNVAPKRRGAPLKRTRRASTLDRAIAMVPVSETTLRRVATWGMFTLFGGAAIGALAWMGVPGMIGTAVAEGMGRAGLRVEQVEVTGLRRMEPMAVHQVALEQESRAMALVDLSEVRDRLLRHGWIADARVSRRLPDTLMIDVVERTPAAIWQNEGQLMLIDAAGVLLEPVRADAMPNLPLVVGEGANAQEPAYQRLIDAAPALRPMIRAAIWVGDRRWNLQFVSGETLMLPEGEPAAARALVKFAEMDGRDRLLGSDYVRFDMRDPSRLVLRRRGGIERSAAVAPVAAQ